MERLDEVIARAVEEVFARHGVTEFRLVPGPDPSEAVFMVEPVDYDRIDELVVSREIAAVFGGTTKVGVTQTRLQAPGEGVILRRPRNST